MNKVDKYWNERPIRYTYIIKTMDEIKRGIHTADHIIKDSYRFSSIPKIKRLLLYNIYDDLNDKVVLDYGCGPGDSIIDIFEKSNIKNVVGIDISTTALEFAKVRFNLCGISDKIVLLKVSDNIPKIPLEDKSIDYITCLGVIHHTTHPISILKEFHRILKDNGKCMFTVYNKDSTTYHFKWVLGSLSTKTNIDDYCRDRSDKGAPIGNAYTVKDFTKMCNEASFNNVEFLGGYWPKDRVEGLSENIFKEFMENDKIDEEHKNFMRKIDNSTGYPKYNGKICGYVGTYLVRK